MLHSLHWQMVSVERVLGYSRLPQESPLESALGKAPPGDWPSRGEIRFENLSLKYADEGPLILKSINCHIAAGEKVPYLAVTISSH